MENALHVFIIALGLFVLAIGLGTMSIGLNAIQSVPRVGIFVAFSIVFIGECFVAIAVLLFISLSIGKPWSFYF